MFLSIVISAYNVSKYIGAAIESCIHQNGNYKLGENYEIICINDGSTDGTESIINKYLRDGITLFSKVNGGLSSARNFGYDHSKGRYIWFVDGDDMIDANAVHVIIDSLKRNVCDGLVVKHKIVGEDYHDMPASYRSYVSKKFTKDVQMAWQIIVSVDYLRRLQIRFDEKLSPGEDTIWSFYLFLYEHYFLIVNAGLYIYRQRGNSIMHTRTDASNRNYIRCAFRMIEEYRSVLDRYDNTMLPERKRNLKLRIDYCTQNIQFTNIWLPVEEQKVIMSRLKSSGCYPYRILWIRLFESNSFKQLLLNGFCLFFPYEWYYNLVKKIIN